MLIPTCGTVTCVDPALYLTTATGVYPLGDECPKLVLVISNDEFPETVYAYEYSFN